MNFQQILNEVDTHGYCYLPNAFKSDGDALDFFETHAELVGQYNGARTWEVQAKTGYEEHNNSGGMGEVYPHTEAYEMDLFPPQYVALYCIKPDRYGEGKVAVVDMRPFLDSLEDDFTDELKRTIFNFKSEKGLYEREYGHDCDAPILLEHNGSLILRFCTGAITGENSTLAKEYQLRALEYFNRHCTSEKLISQAPGSLLIWNNHFCIHSRATAFRDKERHLVRFWMNRRSVKRESLYPVIIEKPVQAAILFADVRGYSAFVEADTAKANDILFHGTVLPEILDSALRNAGMEATEFIDQNIWGDGIFCCHSDVIAMANFALALSKACDEYSRDLDLDPFLRLRTALHYGDVFPNEQPFLNSESAGSHLLPTEKPLHNLSEAGDAAPGRNAFSASFSPRGRIQYNGMDMVTPARLEPLVVPGQVWCTQSFHKKWSAKYKKRKLSGIVADNLENLEINTLQSKDQRHIKKDHEFTYRLRYTRPAEAQLVKAERSLRNHLHLASNENLENIDRKVKEIIRLTRNNYSPPSQFIRWENVIIRLIRVGAYKSAEKLLERYSGWLTSQNLSEVDEAKSIIRAIEIRLLIRRNDEGDIQRAEEMAKEFEREPESRSEFILLGGDLDLSLALVQEDVSDAIDYLASARTQYQKVLSKKWLDIVEERKSGQRLVGISYYADGARRRTIVMSLYALVLLLSEILGSENVSTLASSSAGVENSEAVLHREIASSILTYKRLETTEEPFEICAYILASIVMDDSVLAKRLFTIGHADALRRFYINELLDPILASIRRCKLINLNHPIKLLASVLNKDIA
jgi:hypothetical protein